MDRRKLNSNQVEALKKATLRKNRISDIQPKKVRPSGEVRREFARAREMEQKIEEFFTAPRNFDFSIDVKQKKRWSKGKVSQSGDSWHTPLSSRYKSVRLILLGEKNRKYTITTVTIIVILVLVWLSATLNSGQNKTIESAGIGDSANTIASEGLNTSGTNRVIDLPEEQPVFSIIFPSVTDRNESNTKVVRVSPQDKVPAYAYVDAYHDAELQVSQQELPPEFSSNEVGELARLAESFQATNIIEINGEKVYHGYSTLNGEVQSLLFIKNKRLIFIASDKKINDELWVSYITSME